MTFKEWMRHTGLSPSTISKYESAINGVLTAWAIDNKLVEGSLNSITSKTQFELIASKIHKLPIYKERNERGHHMYSSALIKYAEYLTEDYGSDIESDIEFIINDSSINTTEKNILIKSRIGQGLFRQKLIGYWDGCSVTSFKDTNLLIASHIKPWKDSSDIERLDVFNGLLLLPNLDRVFDTGLITFAEDGLIKISPQLTEPAKLGIKADMRLSLTSEHEIYMIFHRKFVYCETQQIVAATE
ncbi:HNH endonuclease [Phormidium sp. CLA17]|uniref:HNH endonuclease n=1 Tax=Leptolyngbya sp. Cla-17 TaxID=2803751 RepID=UPI00149097E3|nr:HNH endonuclease signature motif containing protein [Leptolyngbya sp. Cla-17]MBM0741828.1 HNH endonuclease [Leptolyngbya sp. Cla-17]